MKCNRGYWRRFGMLGAALVVWFALAEPTRAADPLSELKQALPLDDASDPKEPILKFREENLAKKTAALQSIGDLRRALALTDWRDAPHYDGIANVKIRDIDNRFRTEVGGRLTLALEKQTLPSADPNARLSVAALIADMGVSVRALNRNDRGGYARSLTQMAIALTKDPNAEVRQEALRALGNINGSANTVAGVYAGILAQKNADTGARRLAAEGLAQMVRVAVHLKKTGRGSGVEVSIPEMIATLSEVVRASTNGFRDPDSQVRSLSLEAFRLAAQSLSDEAIPENYSTLERKNFPPAGRPLLKFEEENINKLYNEVQEDVDMFKPLLIALRQQLAAVTPALADSDPAVRLAGMNGLKDVASAWQRLRRHVLGLPPFPRRGPAAAMLAGLDPLEPTLKNQLQAIAPLLSESDSRSRRAAATFLMLLDDRAAPMLRYLIAGLTDSDRAIRWIAARALQNLPPEQITTAVPALSKMLFDPDVTLRLAAAETVKNMGPHARAAVDSLADAALRGDADGRIAAMQALTALGPDIAKAAVPKLIEVLSQADADPKVIVGAADTLGQIGISAQSAIPALRRLISHDNPDVRLAASEAILAISAAKIRK